MLIHHNLFQYVKVTLPYILIVLQAHYSRVILNTCEKVFISPVSVCWLGCFSCSYLIGTWFTCIGWAHNLNSCASQQDNKKSPQQVGIGMSSCSPLLIVLIIVSSYGMLLTEDASSC